MVSRTRSVIVAGGFIEGERDRSFEALGPDDQYTDAAAERVHADQSEGEYDYYDNVWPKLATAFNFNSQRRR
jgi:hypothetical protein